MKWVVWAGILSVGFGVFPLRGDSPSVPLIIHTPFVLESDDNPITTQAQLTLPVVPIDQKMDAFLKAPPADADDATFIAYLKAVKAGDSATRSKYLALSEASDDGSKMTIKGPISMVETESFFPKDATVLILGRIPLQEGVAYIVVEQANGNPPSSFLTSVLTKGGGGARVYMQNPWPFLNVLADSISQANLDTFFKGASPGSAGQILSKQDVTDFLFSRANASSAGDVLKAVDFFQKHSGKDSFTSGPDDGSGSVSQADFDKDFAELDAVNQAKWIQKIASDARNIAYVMNFDPVYVAVQNKGIEPDAVSSKKYKFFIEGQDNAVLHYLRGKDGRLRFTNWKLSDDWDSTIRALPAPSASVTQACASALKSAQGAH